MTKPYATLASGELLSTGYLKEPVRALLTARPDGLGEAMLVHLVRCEDNMPLGRVAPSYVLTDDDRWIAKVRQTCKLLGARRDRQGVWCLPHGKKVAA